MLFIQYIPSVIAISQTLIDYRVHVLKLDSLGPEIGYNEFSGGQTARFRDWWVFAEFLHLSILVCYPEGWQRNEKSCYCTILVYIVH